MQTLRLMFSVTLVALVATPLFAAEQPAADEIKLETAPKPDVARQKARDRQRRVLSNNDGGEPVVEMESPTAQDFLDRRTMQVGWRSR